MKIVNMIAKLLTFYIPKKNYRRYVRNIIKTIIYGHDVILKTKNIGTNFVCEGFSCATKNVTIGDNVRFNGVKIMGYGKTKIGNNCQFGTEILIVAQNHNYESTLIPFDETFIYKKIEIGDFVWVGSRVMILPGTKIGEGAIIQGGSVVHGEIPPYAIAGGNPAKVFKYRNIEHFKKLKEQKAFYKN